MARFHPISQLTGRILLFPLALVLFEFATYIAHDMIQPGMLIVTSEFSVGPEWVSTSLTAYLIGGVVLQWLLGPLSDKFGRRPVMLFGILFFAVACMLMHWVSSIEEFVSLRFIQGISLCFIGAVGYAAIQEAFDEALAVRMMALMANVALLAPLAGPLAGAAWLTIGSWRSMFWLFAACSLVAFVVLWRVMPETAGDRSHSIALPNLARNYGRLMKDRLVMFGSFAIGLVFIPILTWVALSPVILMHDEGLSRMQYALLQLPVFLAMIAGNLTLSKLAGRVPIEQPVKFAAWPILIGLSMALVASLMNSHGYLLITAGLSLYAFGAGMVNAGLYRLTLYASNEGKGSVAAMLGMISIMTLAVGIELAKSGYFSGGTLWFCLVNFISGVLWFGLVILFMRERKRRSRLEAL
ncbi:MFS transporter [Pantoea agglomerans]|jgi:DHA1 family multidrug/chloramphenicol efflux transport protein-like MFS transporter|uniref:Multidrug transporter MdfA n=1 Tax=Enterobacter agglomerans TaxID=549 RepID=A0A2S1CSS3_ENTAG|nr:MFS transporter [Pantoea agglomerans]AWD37925.1 putative siderophore MFS transporter DfoS [Pantoea agglomerans]MCX2201051.1 MFS transporter [Pantoea agglomerans]MDN4621801.1 MFS transporter [Pantoea agglomerans]QXB57102.1 MFS transporter [Pantoea agglomerans]UVV74262.1 MFS transporter [Pantoea agglomerans]